MIPNVIACFTGGTDDLGRKMQHHQVHGWTVANREQRVVGIVTSAQIEVMSLDQSFSTT